MNLKQEQDRYDFEQSTPEKIKRLKRLIKDEEDTLSKLNRDLRQLLALMDNKEHQIVNLKMELKELESSVSK